MFHKPFRSARRWQKRSGVDWTAVMMYAVAAALALAAVAVREPPAPAGMEARDIVRSESSVATKNIEDIVAGEHVLSRDHRTGEFVPKVVLRTVRRMSDHLRVVCLRSDRDGELQQIKTTDRHPFWVRDRGWVVAAQLKAGQQIVQSDGGAATVVSTRYEPYPEGIPVYNFEVADTHTCFVSAEGARAPPVLVHNTDCPRLRDPKSGRFVSDPDNPPSPYVYTDAQRRADWKRLAQDPNSPLTAAQRAEIRARGWRGPRRQNEFGEWETMELSHEPTALRDGGTEVVPKWPPEHAATDRHRHLKKR